MITALGIFLGSRTWPLTPKKKKKTLGEVFGRVYQTNFWGNPDSRSGAGSDLIQTAEIRKRIPEIVADLGARTMLDIPCGDFHWMKEVELNVEYIGADIVEELIRQNQKLFGTPLRRFIVCDITKEPVPTVDLVLCRDLLVHLSYQDTFAALRSMRLSGSKYLLTTTFTERSHNFDIPTTGKWRPLNLELEPFKFGEPLLLINEKCTEGEGAWSDKSLGLWRIADLHLPDLR
jgi:hypothetical protein